MAVRNLADSIKSKWEIIMNLVYKNLENRWDVMKEI